MKEFFKTHFGFFSLASLLTLILFFNLTKSSYVFGGAEEGIPFHNLERTIQVYSQVWVDQIPGYPLTFEVGKIPFLYLLTLVETITNSEVMVSSFYISFIFIGSSIAMYFLAWQVFPKKTGNRQLIATLASLFYILNPFALSQVWGRHLSMQLYPLLLTPLMILFVTLGLKTKKYLYVVLASAASALFAGSYNHPSYAITIISACALAIVFYFIKNRSQYLFLFKFSAIFAICFALFNSFWILPYYSQIRIPSDFAGKSENREIVMGLSKFFPLQSVATLQQKFYFEQVEPFKSYYSTLHIKLVGLSIPLIAFFGLTKFRKIKKSFRLFFLFVFIATFFFSTGANKPFGALVLFAMDNFPILDLFRNTFEKTGILLTVCYSLFFAIGVSSLLEKIKKFKLFSSALVFVVYFIVFSLPFWKLEVFTSKNTDNSPPEYIEEFVSWSKTTSQNRIMFLPILDGDSTRNSWDDGEYNGVDITPFIVDKSMTRHLPQLGDDNYFSRQFTKKIYQGDVSNLLDLLGIKYIVVRKDLETTEINNSQPDRILKAAITPSGKKLEVCTQKTKLEQNLFKECVVDGKVVGQYEFLQIDIETNIPVKMEFRILDEAGRRSRWDGKADTDYLAKSGKNRFILPFGTETELPGNFDYSKAKAIEVAYINIGKDDLATVTLNSISLIQGKQNEILNIKKIKDFGKYEVYERIGPDFAQLNVIRDLIFKTDESEIINQENKYDPSKAYVTEVIDTKFSDNQITSLKTSNGFYKVATSQDGPIAIRLNTFFNKGWSVSATTSDNPFVILRNKVGNPLHVKADGFSNLWVLERGNNFTFYYEPALYYKIGMIVSLSSISVTALTLLAYSLLKKRLVRV